MLRTWPGILVLGDDGKLLDDLPMTELFLADPQATVDDLVGPPWPVTVTPEAGLDEIAERLVETRHSWLVVVDEEEEEEEEEEERPLGQILADDVLDMLAPGRPGSGSPGGCHERRAGKRAAARRRATGPHRAPAPARRPPGRTPGQP